MSIADQLREITEIVDSKIYIQDLKDAADILDFVCGSMQSNSRHMDGTASYRMPSGWPLSSVRARSAEEALLKCVEMIREVKEEAKRGG